MAKCYLEIKKGRDFSRFIAPQNIIYFLTHSFVVFYHFDRQFVNKFGHIP